MTRSSLPIKTVLLFPGGDAIWCSITRRLLVKLKHNPFFSHRKRTKKEKKYESKGERSYLLLTLPSAPINNHLRNSEEQTNSGGRKESETCFKKTTQKPETDDHDGSIECIYYFVYTVPRGSIQFFGGRGNGLYSSSSSAFLLLPCCP